MGASSSGGFFYNDSSPEDLAKKIRFQEEINKNMAYESNVSSLIKTILATVNSRDNESIQRHLSTIEDAIHSEIDGTIDLRYAGSVSKHTYVDGLSDVDCLAILDKSELKDLSPNQVKNYFYDMLCKRLPNTKIQIGNLAITVSFSSGVEIQILPALKESNGIKIPSSRRSDDWSHVVKPDEFAKALRYCNAKMSGKLVPVIKLSKSILSSLHKERQMAGYHVEALAIETFLNYKGPQNTRAMIKHFFIEGSKYVLSPIKDKSGQSIHVDDYLGSANSLKRKIVSDSMATIGRKLQNADGIGEVRVWESLLS